MTAAGLTPEDRLQRYDRATADLDPPFALVDLDAMWSNSAAMLRRAAGTPIRVASKSVRCRPLLRTILDTDGGYQGLLNFTLAEALWLAGEGFDNLLVAYPTTDRAALRELAALTAERPDTAPVVMVDSVEHLDLIAAAVGPAAAPIRVSLDFDASLWLARGLIKLGPKRTPVHTPAQARALAERIATHPAVELVGMMSYEGLIAGVGDVVPRNPIRSALTHRIQGISYDELCERRAAAIAAVREVAPLRFVNGGGTGDLERIAGEVAITEAAAGSGFFAPTLFDHYSAFTLQPAALFALPVCRRPGRRTATVLGGGYLASGAGAKDRMPSPYLPEGLKLDALEGTGEVQTPLLGKAAGALKLGARVYFRHTKAGELCERFDRLHLIQGDVIVDEVPTYRGEGRTFL